jgi:putative ABC transport system permease protein
VTRAASRGTLPVGGHGVPALAWGGGIGAALLIGTAAGLLPALRVARMSPSEALWAV